MGAVYKFKWGRKGRYIYNRDRLHKVGFNKKHKLKHRVQMKQMEVDIKKALYLTRVQSLQNTFYSKYATFSNASPRSE